MRCANCNAENDDKAKACAGCGATLKRRRARKRDDDEPVSPEAEAHNREAVMLYRWSLLALVPVAGLVLGPMVAWRAWRFGRRVASDPALAGSIPTGLAFWVGVICGATSWLGLGLMVAGWW